MKYETIDVKTISECEAALGRNNPKELLYTAISIGLYAENLEWAQTFLLMLAAHHDETVPGNAILSFGHLARRFGRLDKARVSPVVTQAVLDSSEYVRGQTDACVDDINQFLGWGLA